jgi:hypothetical protein
MPRPLQLQDSTLVTVLPLQAGRVIRKPRKTNGEEREGAALRYSAKGPRSGRRG